MNPVGLLLTEWVIVVVGVLGIALTLRLRWGASLTLWLWGALAFVLAQLVRLPLLTGLTLLLRPYGDRIPDVLAYGINLAVLSLTAGVFEESARWLLLRGPARHVRHKAEALMFGAGHGGIEAILLIGIAVFNALVLLSAPDLILAQVQTAAPEQVEVVRQQIEALRRLTWGQVGLTLWERAIAISAHMALTLLVWRSVVERRWQAWGLAVLAHAGLNASVLLGLRWGGPVVAEGVGTVWALAALVYIVRVSPPGVPEAPGSPTGVSSPPPQTPR